MYRLKRKNHVAAVTWPTKRRIYAFPTHRIHLGELFPLEVSTTSSGFGLSYWNWECHVRWWMTGGRREVDCKTGDIWDSADRPHLCGLLTFSAACSGFGSWLALGALCRWVNNWRTDGGNCKTADIWNPADRSHPGGIYPLDVFCNLLKLWIVIGIESAVWVSEWLTGGREEDLRQTYKIQPIDSNFVGCSFLMNPWASGHHWHWSCCVVGRMTLGSWMVDHPSCPKKHSHHTPWIFSAHIHPSDDALNRDFWVFHFSLVGARLATIKGAPKLSNLFDIVNIVEGFRISHPYV